MVTADKVRINNETRLLVHSCSEVRTLLEKTDKCSAVPVLDHQAQEDQ